MTSYAIVLSFAFENEQVQTLVLDTVKDASVQLSSTITEHPLPTGEFAADHMFNNPLTMSISGSFSLNGSQSMVITGDGNKLMNVQTLFEKIKSTGTLCDIVKVHVQDSTPRFLHRSNMALQNITWVEKINSLSFTFSFREIIAVDVQEYDVDISDSFAPSVTEPQTLSFTDTLIDWEQVDAALVQALIDGDLITDDFLEFLGTLTQGTLIGIIASAVLAKIVFSICSALGASGPAGWIALAAIAGVGLFIGGIVGIVRWFKRQKYRIEQFDKYRKDKKNQKEVQRFSNFVGEIHAQISQLNTAIEVYQISANEEQECMLTIGNNYYIFKLTKNNTSGNKRTFGLKAYDINEVERCALTDISGSPMSFYDCTGQNYLFRADETGEYVYLLRTSDSSDEFFAKYENYTEEDFANMNETEKAEYDKLNSLTNYYIVVSAINPDEFNKALTDIIKNALLK